jgi:ppGpp synthetase/RelA/SpoT-type nucleotidyltranferase
MNLKEYENTKKEVYKNYSSIVRKILLTAIDPSEYRILQIQNREKSTESLIKKLTPLSMLQSESIELEIKDLAGCRIIFYLNGDVDKFFHSSIIQDNFAVIEYKRHNTTDKKTSSNDYYIADHFIVELKPDRTALPEYAKYKGLKCEIQVHTILNHAFSETNHDIIYKKPNDNRFGSPIIDAIEKRLVSLAEKYLLPAGHEFQKVQNDLTRYLQGKSLFDRGIIKQVSSNIDNNERYIVLEEFNKNVLPNYDDLRSEFGEILNIATTSLKVAKNTPDVLVTTHFGTFPGKKYIDVLTQALKTISFIRYLGPKKIFLILIELYSKADDEVEKKIILEKIKDLADYNLKILEQANFIIQIQLCTIIDKWDSNTFLTLKEVIKLICGSILQTSVEDTEFNYREVTFKKFNLEGTKELLGLRNKAISYLMRIYKSINTDKEKQEVINLLNSSTRTPSSRQYSDSLLLIILKNSVGVVDFYTRISTKQHFLLLENIEKHSLHLFEISNSIIKRKQESKEIIAQAKILSKKTNIFKRNINANKEFVIYKTLVGFNSVFLPDWENENFDYNEKDRYRKNKITEFINSMSANNYPFWEGIIIKCATTESNDLASFNYFVQFLESLGKEKPEFSYSLINKKDEILSNSVAYFIKGLLDSTLKAKTYRLIHTWISKGKHLDQIAWVFKSKKILDENILCKIFIKAKKEKDSFAIIQIISAILSNYNKENKHLIKSLFIPAISELTKFGNTKWVQFILNPKEINNIFSDLTKSEVDVVLKNLLLVPSIDYNVEQILFPITEKYPEKILSFLGKRINLDKKIERYEPIPYDFQIIHKSLAKNIDETINIITSWYDGNKYKFHFNGAKLIELIFSEYNSQLNNKLSQLIDSDINANLPIVIAILKQYKGDQSIYDLCRKIVTILPKKSSLLPEIRTVLLGEGGIISTSGEFGRVAYYQNKKEQILPWTSDKNKKVQFFALNLIKDLNNIIASEQRLATNSIEMEKRDYEQ